MLISPNNTAVESRFGFQPLVFLQTVNCTACIIYDLYKAIYTMDNYTIRIIK